MAAISPIGSKAAGAAFSDTWTLQDVDIAWLDLIEAKHPALWRVVQAAMTASDKSYLVYMAARLLEMQRVLKPSGSIYLHCDPTMSHYLKLTMDAVFGRGQFRNEIIWAYTGPGSPRMRQFNRKHDTILWYSRGDDWTFNRDAVRIPHKKPIGAGGTSARWAESDEEHEALSNRYAAGKIPETWWPDFSPVGRIASERVGYPTQKPRALLERIIRASTNEGDLVLDPFAGCATACVAAELLERQWVGIDISPVAADLVRDRMQREVGLFYQGATRTDIPQRTDVGDLPAYNSRENRERLYGAQAGHCNGCGEHFLARNLTVDHIIAQASGGTDHIDNLQLLCGYCNSVKGDRGQEYLVAKLAA